MLRSKIICRPIASLFYRTEPRRNANEKRKKETDEHKNSKVILHIKPL